MTKTSEVEHGGAMCEGLRLSRTLQLQVVRTKNRIWLQIVASNQQAIPIANPVVRHGLHSGLVE
jgi:ribosomal protein L18